MPAPKNPPSMSEKAQEILSERQPSVLEKLWGESTDRRGSSHDAPHRSERALEALEEHGALGHEPDDDDDEQEQAGSSQDAPHMSEHALAVLDGLLDNETPDHSDEAHDAPHTSDHAKEVLVELIGVHSHEA